MRILSCVLAMTFVLTTLCAPAVAAEPRVQDRATCEEACVAQCAQAPMKKFLCERRCRNNCKKDIPSATDKKRR